MSAQDASKRETASGRSWRQEGEVLHIRNQWSPAGRLFLAPFLIAGLGLVAMAWVGVLMELARGRVDDLTRELPMALGMTLVGSVLAAPCWMGVFSWFDAVLDGRKRTIKVEEGAWPWIKRWTEKSSAFRSVEVVEVTLHRDRDGGSPIWRQAVHLIRSDKTAKPFVLERCDSYAEAQALANAVSSLLGIPRERRKK